ncbi:MAG: L,D-transpeptidase [Verrucomicrobia bacterium]|nr:L,D-transpeptidase [Verrucomicrobiota bacterium]
MPRSLRLLAAFVFTASFALPFACEAKPATTPAAPKVPTDDAVRLQVFLDRENFGPGKIDGSYGGFTKLAWLHWQAAHGVEKPANDFDPQSPQLAAIDPLYIAYTITTEDLASLGPLPSQLAEQAKLKAMSYTELSELLGERFHSSVDFLKKLNAPKKIDTLKAGDTVTVPNVQPPFDLAQVGGWRDLQRAQAAANKKNAAGAASSNAAAPNTSPSPAPGPTPVLVRSNTLAGDSAAPSSPAPSASPTPTPAAASSSNNPTVKPSAVAMPALPVLSPAAFIHVSVKECYLELRDNGRTIAAFPVTPGSSSIPTPVGEWKIVGKALFPEFRWDKEMLLHGKRSSDAYELPPGPNSPVGIAWMQLSKPGIGLHGTNNPETIGRAASHGCVRLANWDAFKLYNMVEKGMRVVIE